MRLTLTVMCMSGVGAFGPLRLALKPPGIDNAPQ